MCSIFEFDTTKSVFKIMSVYFSSLSTDTYAKMTKSKKLLLSPIDRITCWIIICSIQLYALYVSAENVINIYIYAFSLLVLN